MLRDYIFEIKDKIKKINVCLNDNQDPVPWKWRGTDAELDKIVYEDYEGLIDVSYEREISAAVVSHEIVQRIVEDKKGLMDLKNAAEIVKEIKAHYL
jgi:hypothetical protein